MQKYYITSPENCKGQFCRGRRCFPVSGVAFVFMLIGVATVAAIPFKLVDVIERG